MQLQPNTPSHNRFNPKFPAKQSTKNKKLIWVLVAMIVVGVVLPACIIDNTHAGEHQPEVVCVEPQMQLAELLPVDGNERSLPPMVFRIQ